MPPPYLDHAYLWIGEEIHCIPEKFAGGEKVRVEYRKEAAERLSLPDAAADLESIRGTMIRSPGGAELPLHALAELQI